MTLIDLIDKHPFLTFFVIVILLNAIVAVARYFSLALRIRERNKQKEKVL